MLRQWVYPKKPLCSLTDSCQKGTGKSTKEILRRIDYGGSLTLMGAVSINHQLWDISHTELGRIHALIFKYTLQWKPAGAHSRYSTSYPHWNDSSQWSDVSVYFSLLLSFTCLVLFFLIELFVAIEPVLPSFLLTQKVPILVGASNALVAVCNLSVTYYFPMWFQTVMLSSASTAGTSAVSQFMHKNPNMWDCQDYTSCQIVSVYRLVQFLQGEHAYLNLYFPCLLTDLSTE
jgi:hypothetical protein